MKKLIITTLLTLQLFAQSSDFSQNPFIYSALGNKIYNNVNKIEKLQFMLEYEADKNKIKKYVKDVQKTKDIGFKIQDKEKNIDKATYLKALRELSLTNDYYINKINDNLISSIKSENNILFLKSVNSGLIDIDKNKKAIIKYYYAHKDSIDATGILQNIIDEHNKKPVRKGLTNAELEKIEINRIRKKDKAAQEAIERLLEEEVIKKKINIRKEQKKELGI